MSFVLLVDPSGSAGGPAVARNALRVVADAVRAHSGTKPSQHGNTPARPRVRVWVRRVASDSYAADATALSVELPEVPGLPARPPTTDGEATAAFLSGVETAKKAWAAAESAGSAAASQMRSLSLPSEDSDIAGAVSASADLLGGYGGRRVLLVVSDLEQAGAPGQSAGSLRGTDVVVAQVCVKGVSACSAAKARFSRLVARLRGAAPTYVRPESLADVVPGLLEEQL